MDDPMVGLNHASLEMTPPPPLAALCPKPVSYKSAQLQDQENVGAAGGVLHGYADGCNFL